VLPRLTWTTSFSHVLGPTIATDLDLPAWP
jgi:hypothetical protein